MADTCKFFYDFSKRLTKSGSYEFLFLFKRQFPPLKTTFSTVESLAELLGYFDREIFNSFINYLLFGINEVYSLIGLRFHEFRMSESIYFMQLILV